MVLAARLRIVPLGSYFYRATRMHSAVYAVVSIVHLSVRPSVTRMYCVETTELIIKQLLVLDCSLRTPNMEHISLEDPFIGGVKYERSVEKIRYDATTEQANMSEAILANRHMRPVARSVSDS